MDDAGNSLFFKIDRNGWATQYAPDNLGRTTAENWLAGNPGATEPDLAASGEPWCIPCTRRRIIRAKGARY